MSSLTAYFGQVSAIVEFLGTYEPIVFHRKKYPLETIDDHFISSFSLSFNI